jgi:hypothetical protein
MFALLLEDWTAPIRTTSAKRFKATGRFALEPSRLFERATENRRSARLGQEMLETRMTATDYA